MKISYQQGFTLIELLVVISIIGVLSSVVLASMTTAKLKAKDAAVKSALAQMELLLAQEYSDTGTYRGLQSKDWNDSYIYQDDCNLVFPPDSATNIYFDLYGWNSYAPQSAYPGGYYNYTSPYRADMVKLCNELVKYSPKVPSGNGIRFGFAASAGGVVGNDVSTGPNSVYAQRYDVYSISARLPSTGNFICFGSNGKSEAKHVDAGGGLLMDEPGCPYNVQLMNM